MKKLFFTIALLASVYSYSQFSPTLEENHSWTRVSWSYWAGGYTGIINTTVLGEETINGKIYKIIYNNNEITNCRLREEDGIIYSYEEDLNDEKIMINLNLEIGDVLSEDYFCLGGGGGNIFEYRVIDVSTQFIAGEDRKVIVLEGYDSFGEPFEYIEWWIEGIGSSNGLVPFGFNFDFQTIMTCFTENGEITYFNDFNTCTPPILSNEDYFKTKIILSPNPITDKSFIKFPTEASIDFIMIYNISGKLIKEEVITANNYILNNSDFTSGLYFYQVSSLGKVIKTSKFIVK